jgi:hypothetical protein
MRSRFETFGNDNPSVTMVHMEDIAPNNHYLVDATAAARRTLHTLCVETLHDYSKETKARRTSYVLVS